MNYFNILLTISKLTMFCNTTVLKCFKNSLKAAKETPSHDPCLLSQNLNQPPICMDVPVIDISHEEII